MVGLRLASVAHLLVLHIRRHNLERLGKRIRQLPPREYARVVVDWTLLSLISANVGAEPGWWVVESDTNSYTTLFSTLEAAFTSCVRRPVSRISAKSVLDSVMRVLSTNNNPATNYWDLFRRQSQDVLF